MKIYIYDIIVICSGLIFGTFQIFIDHTRRISFELTGILSFVLSIWLCISCIKSWKEK
ncbi:hypothetical protein JOC76_000866 [Neobacillus cucumis]|uniref:hypothetical protein n=1 Tax=Neobacillus cucumis TaxID=1740721 RepID=UPI001FDDB9E6|nr:hypothetical protein [Neobacillus cucumis]MED4226934.1 hypothetical protein [Neobacillus cucumis]